MSVNGGDSWAREAQCRKRRVEDLLIEGVEASAYMKLSNGKFACLVCPNNPVLDTLITLSTHVNGSRHVAARLRLKDRELATNEEVRKRLASSSDCGTISNGAIKQRKTVSEKPLIERTQKAASEVLHGEVVRNKAKSEICNASSIEVEAVKKGFVGEVQPVDYRARLEWELKFTAAGWKRDGHGRWFKDENVEFDSDEEDPNIVLNKIT